MKSGKQKRTELKAKQARQQEKEKETAREEAAQRGVTVNPAALAPNRSYDSPDFMLRGYYQDLPFICQSCGKQEVWRATQQKWWYEVAKGDVFTTARFCRPCRRKERERKEEARRVHLEGIARKGKK